jgi:hypothetical protein
MKPTSTSSDIRIVFCVCASNERFETHIKESCYIDFLRDFRMGGVE